MWTRAQLKSNAKEVLRVSYWKAFLASLLMSFATRGEVVNFNYRFSRWDLDRFSGEWVHGAYDKIIALLPFIIGTATIALLIGLAISVLVFKPLEVGATRYFLESTQHRFRLEELAYGFTNGSYWNVVSVMLLRYVYNLLWFLLLIIPGIVKSYAYSMVPYLLSENPKMAPSRAIELSNAMTRGHKWEMFILDLSFLGWLFLGSIALGVGVLFVLPYYNSTRAQLYLALRTNALRYSIVTLSELEGT